VTIDRLDFVMIEVRYKDKGQLGNNMFQYCLGRIPAEELGFALQAGPISGFPNTEEKIEGLSIQEPVQILTGQKIDWDEIRADRSHRRIVLDWLFSTIRILPAVASQDPTMAGNPSCRSNAGCEARSRCACASN
jgi:hypothetical protein